MDVMTQPSTAAEITARLDRLPMTRHHWTMVSLISLGGCFEVYDLFFSGYVAPGLFRAQSVGMSTQHPITAPRNDRGYGLRFNDPGY